MHIDLDACMRGAGVEEIDTSHQIIPDMRGVMRYACYPLFLHFGLYLGQDPNRIKAARSSANNFSI